MNIVINDGSLHGIFSRKFLCTDAVIGPGASVFGICCQLHAFTRTTCISACSFPHRFWTFILHILSAYRYVHCFFMKYITLTGLTCIPRVSMCTLHLSTFFRLDGSYEPLCRILHKLILLGSLEAPSNIDTHQNLSPLPVVLPSADSRATMDNNGYHVSTPFETTTSNYRMSHQKLETKAVQKNGCPPMTINMFHIWFSLVLRRPFMVSYWPTPNHYSRPFLLLVDHH